MDHSIRIFHRNADGTLFEIEDVITERKATDVVMWYDRHYRHWVIYPVDAEGNQLKEAVYGFGKKEAMAIKAEMLKEIKEDK